MQNQATNLQFFSAASLSFYSARLLLSFLIVIHFFIVGCTDSDEKPKIGRSDPVVKKEWLDPSKQYPDGLLRMQMEDVLFEVPNKKYQPVLKGKKKHDFDITLCWVAEKTKLLNSGSCVFGKEPDLFHARLQFRVEHKPTRAYYQSLTTDYNKQPNYLDRTVYILRASTEYPDLKEYYLPEQKKAFQFLLDYTDPENDRVVKEVISCVPGFRGREKLKVPMGSCAFGVYLSPHVIVATKFDSRIMSQVKAFEEQVYQLVSSLVVNN